MDSPSVVRRRQEMAAFAAAQAQAPPESACLYCRGGGCPYCRVPESEAAPEPVAERPFLLARLTSWRAPQEPEGPDAQSEADASAAGEDMASTPETEVEESAPEEEEGWGARGLQRLAFWRAATEEPPPPPTKGWFLRADPAKLREVHGRMVSWYEGQVALRQRWGPFPKTPELLETWPGFVRVTNAFMDAEDWTPVAVQVTRPEVARPVAGTSTAPFATVVNVQRVVRGWSARGLQRLASWRARPEEEA